MKIRKYLDNPEVYVPDIGQVVMARRSPIEPFTRAVILFVRRSRGGYLKLTVQWLEDAPTAGVDSPKPIVAGTRGWITTSPDRLALLVKEIDGGPAPLV